MNRMSLAVRRPSLNHLRASDAENARARWRVASPAANNLARAEMTDAALVAKHLAGDSHAFAELVKRYTRAVYNIAFRFTNDAADAEHIAQETFLRAWHALPRLDATRPLKPYLVKIAINLCRDWAERTKTQTLDLDEHADTLADNADDPLETLSDMELRARVRAKLEQLPPLYRAALAMRYTEDMSYEEIAAALDVPLNTVRTHLHRAKARLRALLEQDE